MLKSVTFVEIVNNGTLVYGLYVYNIHANSKINVLAMDCISQT